jgi:hypothetical protein
MWFTETPWPPMLIFLVAAMSCGWMWAERRQRVWLVGAIACVALTAGVWAFERSVVTPREQIEQSILDLAQAFQERRQDDLLAYISPRADEVRAMALYGLALVSEVKHLRVTATDVTMLAAGSRARADFRVNGNVSIRGYGKLGHRPTRWDMTWQQEGGEWRIIDVQRIDPITGKPMDLDERDY